MSHMSLETRAVLHVPTDLCTCLKYDHVRTLIIRTKCPGSIANQERAVLGNRFQVFAGGGGVKVTNGFPSEPALSLL